MLPSVVARDLDRDPEQLSLVCLGLLRYSEAHAAYRRAKPEELKHWEGSSVMREIVETEAAEAQAAYDALEAGDS